MVASTVKNGIDRSRFGDKSDAFGGTKIRAMARYAAEDYQKGSLLKEVYQ